MGDNTNPFESQGYAPIDEGVDPGNDPTQERKLFDAQRTSANSQDSCGKILRITPTADGKYSIPAGNLWTADKGRPETYVMGNRNPTGALVGTKAEIPVTGGWQTWQDVTVPLTDPGGTHKYCFYFEKSPGDLLLFNLNYIDFTGPGVGY